MTDDIGLPIRGFGSMMLVAIAAAVALGVYRAGRVGIRADIIFSLTFWGFIPGILGARLFYVIEYWDRFYRPGDWQATLAQVVNIAEGGLVVYGSMIGGLIGVLAFLYKHRLPVLAMLDLIAPSVLLGMAIGRLGCFLNGCCFGGPCDRPWAVEFPAASPPHVHQVERGLTFIHGLRIPADPDAPDGGPPLIAAVESGSGAEKLGIRAGGRITAVNGQPVNSSKQAEWLLLHAHRPQLVFLDQSSGRIGWILGRHPHFRQSASREPADPLRIDGATFGADDGPGPIVREVRPGSAAARNPHTADFRRVGLVPGQPLVAVNGRPVRSLDDLRRFLAEHERSPWVSVEIAGRPAAVEWTIQQPPDGSRPIHPTQLYSFANDLTLCLLLLAYAPFRRREGVLTALTLTLYPITRFVIEIIRTDEAAVFGTGLSISQNVSLVVLAAAAILWCWILFRPAARPKPPSQ
jgi:prolipoprotein diacylglyceryltransferase